MSTPTSKSYPRGPSTGNSQSSSTASPNASKARFSSKSPSTGSPSANKKSISPNLTPRAYSPGGTTLIVDGMGSRKASSPSSFFKSTTSVGDAHIKALSSQINKVPFRAAPSDPSPHSTVVAFGATGSNERNSHYKDLLKRTGGSTIGSPLNWGDRGGQPSACYRSKSPIACAHILALNKPVDPVYSGSGTTFNNEQPSSFYRSGSSIADAHIKALGKPHEATSPIPDISKGIRSGVQAAFKSNTSIADAHIKAVPKPADVCVAYRDS